MASFIIWFFFVAIVTVILFGLSTIVPRKHSEGTNTIFVIAIIVFAVSPIYYEFPNPGLGSSIPVTFENGKTVYHTYGMFAWEWSEYSNVPKGTVTTIESIATPITVNPKFIKIRYTVGLQIADPNKYYSKTYRKKLFNKGPLADGGGIPNVYDPDFKPKTINNDIRYIVEYHAYNFNSQKSKDIAEFDNPMDREQQENFKKLLQGYFNPLLEKDGLAVANTEFKLIYF